MGMIDPALIAACRGHYVGGASTLWHRPPIGTLYASINPLRHI
jgi:hypothetical protein